VTLAEIVRYLESGFDEETGEVLERPEIEAQLADKLQGCHTVVKRWRAVADGAKAEARRLSDRAAMFSRRAEALDAYVFQCLQAAGERKVVTDTVTASIRKGSERVEVTSVELVPDDYIRSNPTVDKAAVKAAIKAGKDVPGITLERGPDSLSWR